MADGHLNKCIDCAKKDIKLRTEINTSTPEGLEKERKRNRDKYKRLNYKEKQKVWDKDKPWKSESKYKNLSRKFKTPKGYELHHWNYNTKFLEDVILMTIKQHRCLHKYLTLSVNIRIFKSQDSYLTTKKSHLEFIDSLGLNYLEY
tara:strand:- start:274 stop:711 length:438 start_codon:yes stop_codon:yes gene_type:complete